MRLGRWCLIFFQLLWLNVVLPGHTRGVVTMPGGPAADRSAAAAAVPTGAHACCPSKHAPGGPSDDPTPQQRARCAVCFYAAHMAPAPPAISPLAELHQIDTLPAPGAAVAPSLDRPLTHPGRGPPPAC